VALAKRNVSARPTEYIRKLRRRKRRQTVKPSSIIKKAGDTAKKKDFFQNEFADEKPDSNALALRIKRPVRLTDPVLFFPNQNCLITG
jgi:hypothetical protein